VNRYSPDESQTGINVHVFPALLQDRREVLTATSTSGNPNAWSLDLGDNPPRLGPGSGLIAEIGMEPAHMVRWSSDWAREQIADPALQNLVGR
jgi:hypothetical protein